MKKPTPSRLSERHREGLGLIEASLNPRGQPVLGLYLYTVTQMLMKGISRNPRYRKIRPHLIGTPAILAARPGISQTEVADLMGAERATIGLQVNACIKQGWVRRTVSAEDRRKYVLELTAAGRAMLRQVQGIIAEHERLLGADLSKKQRGQLRSLLTTMITGAMP